MKKYAVIISILVCLSVLVSWDCKGSKDSKESPKIVHKTISDRFVGSELNQHVKMYIDENQLNGKMINVYIIGYDSAHLSILFTAYSPDERIIFDVRPDEYYFIGKTLVLITTGIPHLQKADSLYYRDTHYMNMIQQIKNHPYSFFSYSDGLFEPPQWKVRIMNGDYAITKFNGHVMEPSFQQRTIEFHHDFIK